jgi:DNA processing protein
MDNYPHKFSQIKTPPYLFYAIGNLHLLNQKILGIVGPREMSSYADKVMEALFQHASSTNLVTVSGLARGVDQKCHQLSLQYHIPTIAILGGGVRRYLESSARKLIENIVENGGLVLSEFKLDFRPTKRSFPQRNRLIAAASDVVFLPEAKEGSGSLITANFALEMKKEVFVAPNQLFSPNGAGSNQLISTKQVHLLTNFNQLLKNFDSPFSKKKEKAEVPSLTFSLSKEEQTAIQFVRLHAHEEFSERSERTSLDFGNLLSQLTLLEMKGVIGQSNP